MRSVLTLLALGAFAAWPASSRPAEPDRAARLRCAAAFMIIHEEQQRGAKSVNTYPAMEPRGRQYFEDVIDGEMGERQLDRTAMMAVAKKEIEQLQMGAMEAKDPAKYVDGIMQPCLRMLDARFPPQ
jgi:hypothetical protein